ncbi:hypothetical protein D3C76_127400 [compost metagenome]
MRRFRKAGIVIIVVETFLIGVLAGLLLAAAGKHEARDQPNLITHFDRTDLNRVREMIARFREGKGDNLTMLKWGIDSGPFIHDVYNDGRVIHWFADNSRDGLSANPGKTEYICRAIGLSEAADFYRVELSDCDGYTKDEKISLISFDKNEL